MKKWVIKIVAILILLVGSATYLFLDQQKKIISSKQVAEESGFNLNELLTLNERDGFYDNINQLIVKRGDVTISRSDGTINKVTTKGTLNAGDTLKINQGSEAEIQWFEGSISRLTEGTELTIKAAAYDKDNIGQTKIRIFAKAGTIWSKVVSLVDGESEFSILSANAIAGVRGSTFNYILENGNPIVESIEHSAFLGILDKNRKIKESKTIVSGQQATIRESKLKIDPIEDEKLKDLWHKNNTNEDIKAAEKLKKKNLEQIAELAGPLPGDINYEKKNEAILKYLKSIETPEEYIMAELKIGRIRVYEAIALIEKEEAGKSTKAKKTKESIANYYATIESYKSLHKSAIEAWRTQVELKATKNNIIGAIDIAHADISDELEAEIKNQIKNELKVLDRALEGILADEESLYEIKENIRQAHIELETDPKKKKQAEEKAMERKQFELNDLAKKPGINPELIKKQINPTNPKSIPKPKPSTKPLKTNHKKSPLSDKENNNS